MLVFLLVPVALLAQTDDQMQITREAAKANKKLIVSENMNLTEQEATNFWPVYDEYQKAIGALYQKTGEVIKRFAENYDALTDEKAKSLLNESIAVQEDRVNLQKSYLPRFNKILPAKKVARYYQIENKLDAILRFDLARGIPLAK
jgi:hypothetical protein